MIFKKKNIYNDLFLYNNLSKNVIEKNIIFGYFFYGENTFYGKILNNEMKIYCSDILLCLLNPLIIVKKNDDNTHITIKYNVLHYSVMLFQMIFCILFVFYILKFPINILVSVSIICFSILIYKINFELRAKRINECLTLLSQNRTE